MKKYILLLLACFQNIVFGQLAGTLDQTFGINGRVDYDFGNYYVTPMLSIEQSDNKLIIAAGSTLDPANWILMRFLESGAIDTTYGTNGIVTLNFPPSNNNTFKRLILQPNGKLLILLHYTFNSSIYDKSAIIRFNTDGSRDTTFGVNGLFELIRPGRLVIYNFNMQADGKIIFSFFDSNDNLNKLARVNSNGTIDTSFGTNGLYRPLLNGNYAQVFKIFIQNDDKNVYYAGIYPGALMRYNQDSTSDNSYGTNGFVNLSQQFDNDAMIMQPDNKIILTGYSTSSGIYKRLNVNGSQDNTFGVNGTLTLAYDSTWISYTGPKFQSDGKILFIGTTVDQSANNQTILLRYNSNGTVDNTFGTNGRSIIPNQNNQTNKTIRTSFVSSTGKIYCFGTYTDGILLPDTTSDYFY